MTNKVKFRMGTPVTQSSPALIPGSFLFDTATFCLWLDLDSRRVQIQDPLKLSLTGGQVSGTIEVVNGQGTTVSRINTSGVIQGQYLETTGEIHSDDAAVAFAIVDTNGRIRTRTKTEIQGDLGLGALAYKNSVTGQYTPVGTVSAPAVTKTDTDVLSDAGVVDGMLLFNTAKVLTDVTVAAPTFTGTESTVTLN